MAKWVREANGSLWIVESLRLEGCATIMRVQAADQVERRQADWRPAAIERKRQCGIAAYETVGAERLGPGGIRENDKLPRAVIETKAVTPRLR